MLSAVIQLGTKLSLMPVMYSTATPEPARETKPFWDRSIAMASAWRTRLSAIWSQRP